MLTSSQQSALASFYASGKGYVGIHSASACLFVDQDHVRISGASFNQHPQFQSVTFTTVPASADYAATSSLPSRWTYQEEAYTFLGDPRSNNATVILSVDESSVCAACAGAHSADPTAATRAIRRSRARLTQSRGCETRQSSSAAVVQPRAEPSTRRWARRHGRDETDCAGHATATWSDSRFLNHIQGGSVWRCSGTR